MTIAQDLFNSKTFRKIFSSFGIYTGFNFMNQAIPFLLLPFLTRLLSPADYGILATFTAMIPVFTIILSLGTTEAVVRGYFDKGKKDFDLSKMIFTGLSINTVIFVVVLAGVAGFEFFRGTQGTFFRGAALLFPIIGFCAVVYSIPSKLFIVQKKPLQYSCLELSNTLTEVALSICFVAAGFGWFGRAIGITFANVIFAVVAIVLLFRMYPVRLSLDLKYVKPFLSYGLPVVCHSLGIVMIAVIDRFFLNKLIGVSTTGLYSVAYSIASLIGFFVSALSLAWSPFFYEKLGHATEKDKRLLVKATYIYFLFMIVIAIVFLAVAPLLLKHIIGERFLGASKFLTWLAFVFAVNGMYTIVAGYIFYSKKTYLLMGIAAVTVISSICLDYLLITANGPIGVAQATFISSCLRFALFWILGNIVYPMPWFSFWKKGPICA